MYTVTKYPHGTFSWADCNSTDAEKARQFYADLMGWDMEHLPMGEGQVYTMFMMDGKSTAAISGGQGEQPSHWNNYITVEDVDAMVGKVKELGGTVIAEPFDVFDNGRMMVLQDPTGGIVSLWQAKNRIGAQVINKAGAMCWNELSTRDPEAAMAFYGGLLGWTFRENNEGYYIIENKGRANGGILKMDESWGDHPPTWSVYFTVADVEKAVKRVEELGGTVNVPVTEAEGMRFAVISDPAGAVCSLITADEIDAWEDPTA